MGGGNWCDFKILIAMKKFCLLFVIVVSLLMVSCLKNEDFVTKTIYTGRVVNTQNLPKVNQCLFIAGSTDNYYPATESYVTTYTDANGYFSMTLDYYTSTGLINSGCYRLSLCTRDATYTLNAYPVPLGQEHYDSGTIVIR